MITVTLNPDEMRDVVYALKLAEDDLQLRAAIKESFHDDDPQLRAVAESVGYRPTLQNPVSLQAQATLRVCNRLRQVRARIEATSGPVGGRCVHGTLFSVPCLQCLGKLKGE